MIVKVSYELDKEKMASEAVRDNIFIDLDTIKSMSLGMAIHSFCWPDCTLCRKGTKMPARYLEIKKEEKTSVPVFCLHNKKCTVLKPPKVDVEKYLTQFIKITII